MFISSVVIELQKGGDMLSAVTETGHLVLSSQLASHLQPFVEQTFACFDELEGLEGDILEALGFVVAVQLLQSLIEELGKLFQVSGFLSKLYEPLVSAFGLFIHEDGGRRVFAHLGACLQAGIMKSLLSIVNNKLFAKSIDETLGTASDDKLIRIGRGETHRITEEIAPETVGCGDNDGIVLVFLHAP